MPVNLSQGRRVVGVFNIRFIHIKQPNIFKYAFSQNKVKKTIAKETFSVFLSFSIFLLVSISGSFVNLAKIRIIFINLSVVRNFYFYALLSFVHRIGLYLIISNRSGDIEKNPRPKPNSCQSFSICHYNLSPLRAYITVHEFDVIVYQRLISIYPFYMMRIIYKFKVIIYIGKIIP